MDLSWGKPRIFFRNTGDIDSKWKEMPTPVDGSTTLATTKGEKVEAKIEGGENEAVRFKKNTYALSMQIRIGKGRLRPIKDDDGLITGSYEVMLQPEDITAPGLHISASHASVEDGYSSADGVLVTYTFDAEKKDATTNQVIWGTVSVTGVGETLAPSISPLADAE